MDYLACALTQSQKAVQRSQRDLATLRTQISERDDGSVNPCMVELQRTIQGQQEAAADVLTKGVQTLAVLMEEVDAKAEALGNVWAKEKEMKGAKKSMQRYFEAQNKLLNEQREEYEGLLSLRSARIEHLEDGAASKMQQCSSRSVLHAAMHKWFKKAMLRSMSRQFMDQGASYIESRESAALQFASYRRDGIVKRNLFHRWQKSALQRANTRLAAEVVSLETAATHFQEECCAAQRLLSVHLHEEHSKMIASSVSKTRECELLDDEVGRMKVSLEELTKEFAERTRTYVQQQDEVAHFFSRKEQRLRDALTESLVQLGRSREKYTQLVSESSQLSTSMSDYVTSSVALLWEATARKEDMASDALTLCHSRLCSRESTLRGHVVELKKDIELLAPLSEKVLRLENELSEASQCLRRMRQGSEKVRDDLRRSECVNTMLTERVARLGNENIRMKFLLRWSNQAASSRISHLLDKVGHLEETLKKRQRDYLLQQQSIAAQHAQQTKLLESELEESQAQCTALEKELDSLRHGLESTEAEHYNTHAALHKAAAECDSAHSKHIKCYNQLEASYMENLFLREQNGRLAVELKEALWRQSLLHAETNGWRESADALGADVNQLALVCDQWSDHCEAREAKQLKAIAHQRTRLSQCLEIRNRHLLIATAYRRWRMYVAESAHGRTAQHEQKELRQKLVAHHNANIQDMERSHKENIRRIEDRHAAEREKAADIREWEIAAVRDKHAALLSDAHTRYEQTVRELEGLQTERDELQWSVDGVGSLVVEYCAKSAFTQWRGWAQARVTSRCTSLLSGRLDSAHQQLDQCSFLVTTWMESHFSTAEESHSAQAAIFSEAALSLLGASVMDLSHRNEQYGDLFMEAAATSEALEADNCDLKRAVRRLEVKSQSDEEHISSLQGVVAEANEWMCVQKLHYERALRVWHRLYGISDEHLSHVMMAFDDAVESLQPLIHSSSEISDERRSSSTQTALGVSSQILLPSQSVLRIEQLKDITSSLDDGQCGNTTYHTIEGILSEPFTSNGEETPHTAVDTSQALEIVRLSAAKLVARMSRGQQDGNNNSSAQQIARMEETLADVRHTMRALLEEQRGMAAEMRAETPQASPNCYEDSPCQMQQSSPIDEWQIRLDSLASRYQRVLEAFCDSIEDRRETFYSVNGMLLAAEHFSSELMFRFNENAQQMTEIRRASLSQQTHTAGTSPIESSLELKEQLTAIATEYMKALGDCSKQPGGGGLPATEIIEEIHGFSLLLRTHCDRYLDAMNGERSADASTSRRLLADMHGASSDTETDTAAYSRERTLLCERLDVLERLLVKSKVQLSEAKGLVEHARISPTPQLSVSEVESLQDTVVQLREQLKNHEERICAARHEVEEQLRSHYEEESNKHAAERNALEEKLRIVSRELSASQEETARAQASLERHVEDAARMTTLLREELQTAQLDSSEAVESALSHQRALLELEHRDQLNAADREIQQLRLERDTISCRKTQVEDRMQQRLDETQRAMESLLERHDAEVTLLRQNMLTQSNELDSYVSRMDDMGFHLQSQYTDFSSAIQSKVHYFLESIGTLKMGALPSRRSHEGVPLPELSLYLDTITAACLDVCQDKNDLFLEATVEHVYTGSSQALEEELRAFQRAAECQRDTLETENMQLREHIAALTSTVTATVALSPPPRSSREEEDQSAGRLSHPPSLMATPNRSRSLSADSIELSQRVLRYSVHLSEHAARNAERLENAKALGAQVEDLITRGQRLQEIAEKENLTPDRRQRHR